MSSIRQAMLELLDKDGTQSGKETASELRRAIRVSEGKRAHLDASERALSRAEEKAAEHARGIKIREAAVALAAEARQYPALTALVAAVEKATK